MNIYICQNFYVAGDFENIARSIEEIKKENSELKTLCKSVYKDPKFYQSAREYNWIERNADKTIIDEIRIVGNDIYGVIAHVKESNGLIVFSDEYFEDRYCNAVQYIAQLYNVKNIRAFRLRKEMEISE